MSTPSRIGRYELLEELGRGAMSAVYLARDAVIGRMVAVKTFSAEPTPEVDSESVELLYQRLVREAQSAGRLSHPNIVTIYDVVEGDGEGGFYIVMEYVRGSNLEDRLRVGRPLEAGEMVAVISQIAAALDHLHSRGVVHRDIKPANILITEEKVIKLTDFGIAWQASPGQTQEVAILGTPQYMSPEQIQGLPMDGRADVFSLGVLLYEMVTRHKPFPGETVREVTHQILHEPFVPAETFVPDLAPELEAVIARALAKDPERRYPSAGALAEDLARVVEDAGMAEVDPTAPTRTLPAPAAAVRPAGAGGRRLLARLRRWRLALPVALAAVLAAGVTLGWLLFASIGGGEAPELRPEAHRVLLEEGRKLLEADPEAAAMLFHIAEGQAPDPTEARQLRQEAERLAAERGVAVKLEEARRAMAERHFDEAIGIARNLLSSEEGHDEALEVLTELETVVKEPPTQGGSSPAAGTASRPAPASPPPAAARSDRATLAVDLASEVPRGVLTLYAGERQVLLRPFYFFERRAWIFRRPTPGRFHEEVELEPGSHRLRVLVARGGEPAQLAEVSGRFPRGGTRHLVIQVPAEGKPQVRLR